MSNKTCPQEVIIRKLPIKVGLKDFKTYIDPHLSRSRSGPKQKISRCKIFNYILYVLHTGIQWNQLRTYHNEIHWTNVYKWHNRWSKNGSYRNLFETSIMELFKKNKLDLSILHGDGSNTTAKKGGMVLGTRDTSIRKA
ncbi:transposase [Candidatus Peregrinibacteria bacterium]|nr:transposase [Candidatus Peregrinibacteria bacterium]